MAKEFWFKDVVFNTWYRDGSRDIITIKDPNLITKFEEIIAAQKALDAYKCSQCKLKCNKFKQKQK